MPRRPRFDTPGQLHHVMNRGLSRRPIFDLPSDQRRFLALIACAARAGRIRAHCFCLMQTHFHLLVESVNGDISGTMRWLQGIHGGRYNRTRGRDGPLVRGRFYSIPVNGLAHLYALVRYLDLNPVKAGLCEDPFDYVFGSARLHACTTHSPKWVTRELIERFTARLIREGRSPREAYRETFHGSLEGRGDGDLVLARLEHRCRAKDDLDAFIRADGAGRREWLVRRAQEADGTSPGMPMADVGSTRRAVAVSRLKAPAACVQGPGAGIRCLWSAAEVGLLRDLVGLTYQAIADEVGLGMTTVRKWYRAHLEGLRGDPVYVATLGEVAGEALEYCFGPALGTVSETLATWHLSPQRTDSTMHPR